MLWPTELQAPQLRGERRESNPQPPTPQVGALPLSYAHHNWRNSERVVGIEPTYPAWKAGALTTMLYPQLEMQKSCPPEADGPLVQATPAYAVNRGYGGQARFFGACQP